MARTAIYYRVSTTDQNPDRQIRELRDYAERRGFDVVGEYVDVASGARRSRPELDRMLGEVRRRRVDVVLVWAFDRFARSTRQLVDALEEFGTLGVDFVSYSQQIDTTTAAGKLTFTVLAAIAEFERELIRERVRSGIAARKAKGLPVGGATKRLSTRRVNQIRRLRADGLSISAIQAETGLSRGVISKYGKTS